MSKLKRLTSLYETLATMRRENLQTTFDLVELIHKINKETYIENPEPFINTTDNIDLPVSVRLKWALISLGREVRQSNELKQENEKLRTALSKARKQNERLRNKYLTKCQVVQGIKEKDVRREAKRFKETIEAMRGYINSLHIRINYLTTQLEKHQTQDQQIIKQ